MGKGPCSEYLNFQSGPGSPDTDYDRGCPRATTAPPVCNYSCLLAFLHFPVNTSFDSSIKIGRAPSEYRQQRFLGFALGGHPTAMLGTSKILWR